MRIAGVVVKGLGGLFAVLFRAYHATLRVRILLLDGTVIRPADYPFCRELFALCERDSLALAGLVARARFTVLVAGGRDGDWASDILERLGCRVARGSCLRGGTRALKELLDAVNGSTGPAGIVVDGPLGPSGQAKGGIILCGMHTGSPIRALGAATAHRVTFRKTWSRIYLPLPFSRVMVTVDDSLPGLESARVDDVDDLSHLLTQRLAVMQGRAATAVRHPTNVGWGRDRTQAAALDRLHRRKQL